MEPTVEVRESVVDYVSMVNRLDDGRGDTAEVAREVADLCHNTLSGHASAMRNREGFREAGSIDRLCSLLLQESKDADISEQVARALGNLTCDNLENCSAVVRLGAVPTITALLLNGELRTKECAAATIHNIAFTGHLNREAVVSANGVVRGLISLLGEGLTENSKLQAAAALTSIITLSSVKEETLQHSNITDADKRPQTQVFNQRKEPDYSHYSFLILTYPNSNDRRPKLAVYTCWFRYFATQSLEASRKSTHSRLCEHLFLDIPRICRPLPSMVAFLPS